jgi:D-glycero-D-manno-heptose 1,7-bisphosphate phosphatase
MLFQEEHIWPLNGDGVWIELRHLPLATPGPVLFLDRDGVINEDRHYVGDPAEVALMPGAAELIEEANNENIPVAVITNQSGIDRGKFGWRDFAAVTERIDELLALQGARIDAVAACPFHPDFTTDFSVRCAEWRKPGPRMIEEIATGLNSSPSVVLTSFPGGSAMSSVRVARSVGIAASSPGGAMGAVIGPVTPRPGMKPSLLPGCSASARRPIRRAARSGITRCMSNPSGLPA